LANRLLPPLLLLAMLLSAREGHPESSFDQERCSFCHVRDSVFFSPSFLSPEALKGFDEARLCGSCHNGSVQDDRARLWRGAQHPPAGGEPDRRCSRCHSPHSKGGWGVLAGGNVSLRKGGDAVCTGCHTAFQGRSTNLHEKRLEGGCKECHQAHGGQGKYLLRDSGGGPCLRCHGDKALPKADSHPGPGAGEGASSSTRWTGCVECHPAHRPDDGRAVRNERCAGCHPFGVSKALRPGKSHTGEEDCGLCHTFHGRAGEGGRGFRGKDIRVDILCGKCHSRFWAGDIPAGRSAGTHVSFAGNREDICLRCHRVHDAPSGTPLLRSAKSYSCLECHERQNTIRETGGIVLAHPVFEKIARGRLSAVAKEKRLPVGPTGEIVCRTCHKVHFAAAGTPLLTPGTEKAESCFWCHEGMRGKSHKGKGKEVRADCADCHPVHGRKAVGGDPWAALCLTCHPRPSVHRAGTEDRSVGRFAGLPEFDSRGRKAPYGTISCPTCHQPHGASTDSRRIRKNYRPNGILCTSCHAKEETIVLTPHDLRGVAGNSVCEPCHVPHGGSSPWMWGFRRGGGEVGEETCRACHTGKGMGAPVPKGGHPRNVVPSHPLPDRFPLVRPEGAASGVGVISCPTCHEVHGTGIMPTGRGVGKLLRRSAGEGSPSMCGECHAGKGDRHGKADCLACHPPHSGETPESACLRCHGERQGALFAKHREAGKGCGNCHRAHGGGGDGKGKPGKDGSEACSGCHPSAARVAGTPHAGLGGSACESCHPVHGEPAGFVARPRLGQEIFSPDLPCIRCHRDGGDAPVPKWSAHPSQKREVPTNYGAKVTLETPVSMMGKYKEGSRPLFPLFDDAGKPALSGRMGCLTCHDPHSGGRTGDAAGNRAYLRDPGLGFLSEMCAPCHRGEGVERIKGFHTRPRRET